MLIATISCDWKCLKECKLPLSICQNSHTSKIQTQSKNIKELINDFNNNLLSECVIFAGLEPMLQFEEMYNFIKEFRKTNEDDIVIYTGYYPEEIKENIEILKSFTNIILKFGRYKPNLPKVKDKVLKIDLISNNQWSEKIC